MLQLLLYILFTLFLASVLWFIFIFITNLLFSISNGCYNVLIFFWNKDLIDKLKLISYEITTVMPWLLIFFGITLFMWACFYFNFLSFWVFSMLFVTFWSFLAMSTFIYIIFLDLGFCKNLIPSINTVLSNFSFIRNWFSQWNIFFNIKVQCFYYLFVISVISVFSNLHTSKYMSLDQKKERFVILLNAFSFSMVFLTFSTDWISIIFFWEFLGITSFYLIAHNETQTESLRSALKAFCFNLISDITLVFVLVIHIYITNSIVVDYHSFDSAINYNSIIVNLCNNNILVFDVPSVYVLLTLIFIASIIKSVQIFTFMWLPESMKAPVPASALIHSATLVAAGFLLLIESKSLYIYFFNTTFLIWIGFFTAVCGALAAAYQEDLKKILAFSTIANCGFMLVLLYSFDMRVFLIYFAVHGIFKSICFMFSGEIINYQRHNQDFRTYGTLSKSLLVNLIGVALTLFALAGFPFTIVYVVKHYFIYTLESQISWNILSSMSLLYTLLSLCYATVFIIRVFVFLPQNKLNLDSDLQYEYDYRTTSNLIYSTFSLIISHVFSVSIDYYYSLICLSVYNTDKYGAYISVYFVGLLFTLYFLYVSGILNVSYILISHVMLLLYLWWFIIILNYTICCGLSIITVSAFFVFSILLSIILYKIRKITNFYYEIVKSVVFLFKRIL